MRYYINILLLFVCFTACKNFNQDVIAENEMPSHDYVVNESIIDVYSKFEFIEKVLSKHINNECQNSQSTHISDIELIQQKINELNSYNSLKVANQGIEFKIHFGVIRVHSQNCFRTPKTESCIMKADFESLSNTFRGIELPMSFKSFEEAYSFKEQLKLGGMRLTWIKGYKNGNLCDIRDLIEENKSSEN